MPPMPMIANNQPTPLSPSSSRSNETETSSTERNPRTRSWRDEAADDDGHVGVLAQLGDSTDQGRERAVERAPHRLRGIDIDPNVGDRETAGCGRDRRRRRRRPTGRPRAAAVPQMPARRMWPDLRAFPPSRSSPPAPPVFWRRGAPTRGVQTDTGWRRHCSRRRARTPRRRAHPMPTRSRSAAD